MKKKTLFSNYYLIGNLIEVNKEVSSNEEAKNKIINLFEKITNTMKNQILKNSLTVIGISVCACLFHAETVKAQITFGEAKEALKEIPNWERYGRKELCAPYDSTFLIVKPSPLIDAYKKYIGQQLFLLEVGFYDQQLIYTKPTKYNFMVYTNSSGQNEYKEIESDVYVPKYEKENNSSWNFIINNKEKIVNKYYEITDVIQYDKYPYLQETLLYNKKKYSQTTNIGYTDGEGNRKVEYEVPCARYCFVMKETQSGDTVYTFQPDKFILVGAFVKLKKEHIGKTIVDFDFVLIDGGDSLKLQNKWKCTDVAFVKNNPVFVLKKADNESTEITVDCFTENGNSEPTLKTYFTLKETNRDGKYWALEQEFNKYSNELLAANKAKEKERVEQQEQNTAAKRQRRQVLIKKYGQTMATKILNQEPEIGMTKAMFDDMNMKPWIVSSQTTKTANGIVEAYIYRFGLYRCKKIVIMNQKITRVDTYNCN